MSVPGRTLLGLVAEQHRSHEQRLERASAVRRKRVAFASPRPFPRAEARRLVEHCRGVLVAPDESPDVLVLASGHDVLATPISDRSSLVVDGDEFVRRVGAHAATRRSPLPAAAVASARADLRSGPPRPRASEAGPAVSHAAAPTGGLRVSTDRRQH